MSRWTIGRGRTQKRVSGSMNRTEERYAKYLSALKATGDILEYWFEGVKLRLADSTFYTPDFLVQIPSGELECHEVKGFWEDDARVKIKVAAALYPFRFVGITAKGSVDGWAFEEF